MPAQNSPSLRGELKHQESMARHTSWRVGGPARDFYTPADLIDLALFLSRLPEHEPLLWLGLGSNLLVRDGGFPGTVISTNAALSELRLLDNGMVYAQAGVPCAKVAKFCAANDLVGVEFLAGIPGTMGGALAMNAGAFGGETWDWVAAVETLDRRGTIRQRSRADFDVGYRHARGPQGEWFASALLQPQAGDGQAAITRMKGLLEKRNTTQPTGVPSCGSVFRNPPGDYAGRLVEASGLKGYCVGGACVSQKHANFIINSDQARAADIEALINHVIDTVRAQHGITLQPEVCIVGEAA